VLTPARLRGTELVGMAGGALLVAGVFLPWYGTDASNSHSQVSGRTGSLSAWDVHPILRWLLLAAAVAPLILVWIIVRDHELSWSRGELTAVVGIAAFGLIFYAGVIDRPGEPSGEISLGIGWLLSLLGSILMIVGAARRSANTDKPRKPPGVL
jgi:hypothetical protein